MPKRETNLIAGKHREPLTNADKSYLRGALHTEGVLSSSYDQAVSIRKKLGLGPLFAEGDDA